MSELAEKLITENLQTKNPILDLGNCGLDGSESELEQLQKLIHVNVLIFSNEWWDYYPKEQKWKMSWSVNRGEENAFYKVPENLPPNLQTLIIAGNYDTYAEELFTIKDISAIKRLSNLKHLNISQNQIQDISSLKELINLQSLNISQNQIQDVSVLGHLENLNILNSSSNQIQDISLLKYLSNLEVFYNYQELGHHANFALEAVKNLPNLKNLYFNIEAFEYPPIWYVHLQSKKGKLGDYIHLFELPQIKKIWQLMKTKDDKNMELARQLAQSQGWTEEEFEMYRSLVV